ncbi:MAG: Ig-like domain-containing protein [Archangium sp.]|nr:Ig-like domain-containing protein [Archangium sp.]
MRTLAFMSVLLLSACERIDYIELEPAEIVFKQAKAEKWLEAKCMARNGARAVRTPVSWSVKDPTIATVSAKGLVQPVGDGETEVIARAGDVEARATVQVIYVDRIEVEPKELTIKEGAESVHVKVRAFRKSGKELSDRKALYSSADRKIVQIVGDNAILPLDPGTTTVKIQVEGATASVQVTVEKDKTKK